MSSKLFTAAVVIILLGGLVYIISNMNKGDSMKSDDTTMVATTSADAKMAADSMSAEDMAMMRDPKMTGTWKSKDDAKFTRTFAADGTVTDAYEGDASATDTGTWTVVDPTKEVTGVPAANLAGMTVIRINFEKAGAMFFTINAVSDTDLDMTYLGGNGSLLRFSKVQ